MSIGGQNRQILVPELQPQPGSKVPAIAGVVVYLTAGGAVYGRITVAYTCSLLSGSLSGMSRTQAQNGGAYLTYLASKFL
jgi:hypothetical protein